MYRESNWGNAERGEESREESREEERKERGPMEREGTRNKEKGGNDKGDRTREIE